DALPILWRGPALWAWGRGSVPGGDEDLAQDPRGLGQRLPVRLGALFETVAEPGVATLAASEDHLLSGLGEGDLHLAAIHGMGGAGDEPLLLEPAQGPRHDRRAHVFEVRERARRGLPRALEVGEHKELRDGDQLRGGAGAQHARGDEQHALQLRSQLRSARLGGGALRLPLSRGPAVGHSSRPSTAPRRKYATNMIATTYMSQWTSRALPRTTRISTYITKPAPIPTVIE